MADNKTEKQPGEKEPGTFQYNPGNMSGKPIGGGNQVEADQPEAGKQPDKKTETALDK